MVAVGLVFAPALNFEVGSPVQLHQLNVKARDLSLVCPGPAFFSGGKSGTSLGKPKPMGTAEIQASWSAATNRSLFGAPLTATASNLTDSFLSFSTSTPYVLTVNDPLGEATQGSNLLTAVQLDAVASSRMNGLLGSTCQRPQSEFWIVGGDTSTGREALIILVNAASIDASVQLELLGSGGLENSPGLSGISVAAHSTVVIPVSSFSAKNSTFSVHVKSHGAALAGWIQQKTVRGLTAAGADLIVPTAAASKSSVIPGFFVRGEAAAAKLKTIGDFADLTNLVRLTNPGDAEATALVQVVGATSKTFGTVVQASVPAHTTVDLVVDGLADGDYSIFIESDKPLLASARLNRTSLTAKQKTDFAWLPAVDATAGSRTAVVPKVGVSKLSIANSSKRSAQLMLRGGGLNKRVQIKPGATLTFAVNPASVVLIDATEPVAVSLVVDVDFTLAVLAVLEQRNLGGQVGVLVR
jgi:hypothetical protein